MTKVSAPGKLFIAGEWAILERGNPGIVAAINKRVYADVNPVVGKFVSVSLDDFKIRDIRFTYDGERLSLFPLYKVDEQKVKFAKAAMETALNFLKEKGIEFKPFKIRTWSDEVMLQSGREVKKIGFGSSAAATVAITKAVLEYHGYMPKSDEIFKLSCVAHYFAQGKIGSGFDIAASTYGGLFMYKRFDEGWLVEKMDDWKSLARVVSEEWSRLEVEPLKIPKDMILDIAWTKESASTPQMVRQMQEWAKQNRAEYKKSLDRIANLMREMLSEWRSGKTVSALELLKQNEPLLRELGEKSGVPIETEELRKLSEIANECGGVGKLSGAGGGDCGIAISLNKQVSETIRKDWKDAGLYVIDAIIDEKGVKTEL